MPNYRLLRQTPEIQNQLYSVFYVIDQNDNLFYAKIFSISKLQQHGLDQSLQYNQQVLSDMDGMAFPEYINKITMSIPNDGLFTFITEYYETNLENYMKITRISEAQALRIIDNIIKAVYSIYSNGYWHKSIRPEHFVKINDVWKLDSLVYSEDQRKCKNIYSQYIWNSAYQPPEAYEKNIQTFSDDDFLPIVVWNLGSLLLDLFFSVHKLNNIDIIKCYQGKKFTLQNIKVKKTDIFSKKLKDILANMLHYNPKSRMRLEEVFSNDYLSKEVALLFKQKHKNSLNGAPIKIFTGGKSALSSALLSKQERDKGGQILPLNQMVKSAIQNLNGGISKLNMSRQIKSMNQIQTDQDIGDKMSMADIFDKFLVKRSEKGISIKSSNQLNQSKQSFINNEFMTIIRMYQTLIDKSELLTISGNKFLQIEYKDSKKEIILISKYSVEVYAYLNLKNILQNLQEKVNSLGLDNILFVKFIESKQFQGLKNIVNQKIKEKELTISQVRNQIGQLSIYQRNITDEISIKLFLEVDLKSVAFSDIKISYRKILKISYDFVTKQYNKNSSNEKSARLAMYVVYCLTIDKLYLPNLIDKNFLPYFEWFKEKPSSYIPNKKFQKYVEQANTNKLVSHAKQLLQRFFKF